MRRGQKTSAEQVVLKLRQIEVQTAQGKSLALACKEAEISEQSYYRWRKEYGGLQPIGRWMVISRSRRPSIQLRSVESPTPRSAATLPRDRVLVCANRTASARNSGVEVCVRIAIGTLLLQEKRSPLFRLFVISCGFPVRSPFV